MSIARIYNRTLHRQLKCHAAWLPFANGFRLGDYGVISGGVFQREGNISEFGVVAQEGAETPTASLNFVSEATRITRVTGDVTVNVFPDEPVQARLSFAFEKAQSMVLKAAEIRVHEMTNVAAAARELAKAKRWRHHYKVVRQVWTTQNALVLATRDANTNVSFAASAGVLKRLELGDVDVDVDVSSTSHVSLEMVGKTGPVGLGLFRVKLLGGVTMRALHEAADDELDIETSETWKEDLEDDL